MTVARANNQTGRLGVDLAQATGVGGTVNLGAPWTDATVTSPGYVKLLLAPPLYAGQPSATFEIVYATVTNGSATATIVLRGQEGTSARLQPAGTVWTCGPTAADFNAMVNVPQSFPYVGATSVTCNHSLNRYPASVVIVDGSGNEIIGGIANPTVNQTVVSFAAPQTGTVYIA